MASIGSVNFVRITPPMSIMPSSADYFSARMHVDKETVARLNVCDRELLIFVDTSVSSNKWLTDDFRNMLKGFIDRISLPTGVYNHVELFGFNTGVSICADRDTAQLVPSGEKEINILEPFYTVVSSQKLHVDISEGKIKATNPKTGEPVDTRGIKRTKTTMFAIIACGENAKASDSGALTALSQLRDKMLLDIHMIGVGFRHTAALFEWYARMGTTLGSYQCAVPAWDPDGSSDLPEDGLREFAKLFAGVEKIMSMCPMPIRYRITGRNLDMNLTISQDGNGRFLTPYNGVELYDNSCRLVERYQQDSSAEKFAAMCSVRMILQKLEEIEHNSKEIDVGPLLNRVAGISRWSPELAHYLTRLLKSAKKGDTQTRDYCAACNAICGEMLSTL